MDIVGQFNDFAEAFGLVEATLIISVTIFHIVYFRINRARLKDKDKMIDRLREENNQYKEKILLIFEREVLGKPKAKKK